MHTDKFPRTYEASRARFLSHFSTIKQTWPQLCHEQFVVSEADDLSIDWFISNATEENKKVLIFSIAEHGIEGYVGSAMLEHFLQNYLPQIDPKTTGLLLIHAINPWGMKHHRRVNLDNIDLNRTFLYEQNPDPAFNHKYDRLLSLLSGSTVIERPWLELLTFMPRLKRMAKRMGWEEFNNTWMTGQYRHADGLFYGGVETPKETQTIKELLRGAFENYEQVLHLDMHTGYGPRYQMSVVNSVHEKRSSKECAAAYQYPLIVAANPDEFYAIKGDMIDYEYELRDNEFADKKLYGLAFEFGTFGDGWTDNYRSPFAMHFENAFRHQKIIKGIPAALIANQFEELFNPASKKWKEKALADGDQAMDGILRYEGYI